jgi:hypothetical protein
MTFPKVTFIASQETEAQRLLDIAIYIVNRFWQTKGFLLLPYDVGQDKFSGREIYFPDLNYSQHFWTEAKRLAKNLDLVTMPLDVTPQITIPDPPPNIKELETKWRKVEKPFWDFCLKTFPDYFADLKTFEVWVTRYDRLGSFTRDHAWIHFEAGPGDIAEAVLSGAFRQKHYADGYTWEESEAFVDNLILNSLLNKLFPGWKPTLMGLRTKGLTKHAADSQGYFKKLGYAHEPIFFLNEGQIMTADQPVSQYLTETENEIMKQLLLSPGQVVSFEKIGDIIWKDNCLENYSEWAIAQTIHRLREKILKMGITSEVVQTKRGQGYYLLT